VRIASETRHLQLLVALVEEGSLNAAARRLHVTPSALSQQLRELELRLGGALFERRWRRLFPTSAGRRLTEGARSVLAELERVERDTRTLLAGGATLRIVMACQESYRWLPDVLAGYAAQEPNVDVSIVSEAAADPGEWLLTGRLDVALVADKPPRDRRLKAKRLLRDELLAVVARRHPWTAARSVTARAFASEQLFSDEEALSKDAPLGRLLGAAAIRPRKVTTVPTNGTVALDLVRAGLGVAVMPRWTVSPLASGDGLALVRLGARGLWLEWSAVVRNEPPPPSLATFLGVLESTVGVTGRAATFADLRSPKAGAIGGMSGATSTPARVERAKHDAGGVEQVDVLRGAWRSPDRDRQPTDQRVVDVMAFERRSDCHELLDDGHHATGSVALRRKGHARAINRVSAGPSSSGSRAIPSRPVRDAAPVGRERCRQGRGRSSGDSRRRARRGTLRVGRHSADGQRTTMITLYVFGNMFPEGRGETKDLRAQWALEEVGLPYRVHALDYLGGELDREDYSRISPFRQAPALEDDGFVVSESAAVVLYVAEKAGKLIPADVQGRTRVMQWCFAAVSSVEPTLTCLDVVGIFDSGNDKLEAPVRTLAGRWLGGVERRLEGRQWIACDDFTAADIMMAGVLRTIRKSDLMDPFPNTKAYYERCFARPAWQRALGLCAERLGMSVDDIR